jgi:uncharacterized OsmC-like protein
MKRIVNDLDVDAIEAFVADVSAQPEHATLQFGVTTCWTGQLRSESRPAPILMGNGETIGRDFTITADEPEQIFGSNEAPNPQELLLAGLNACMTVGYVAGAANRGISLTKLEIETKGTLDLRGFFGLSDSVPPGYPALEYVVRIAGDGTPEQFAEIHAEVQTTSPNFDNLARAVRMSATLQVEG